MAIRSIRGRIADRPFREIDQSFVWRGSKARQLSRRVGTCLRRGAAVTEHYWRVARLMPPSAAAFAS
jgi:hypothetical protein